MKISVKSFLSVWQNVKYSKKFLEYVYMKPDSKDRTYDVCCRCKSFLEQGSSRNEMQI